MVELPPGAALAFLAMGVSILVGYVGVRLFAWTRLSDVVVLVGFGALVGFFIPSAQAEAAGPVFAVLAPLGIALILFQGGLDLGWAELRHIAGRAVAAALGTWALTAATLSLVAHFVLGLSGTTGLILGIALAGPGATAMLPLLPHLKLSPHSRAFITIETTLGSTLNAVSTAGIVAVLLAQTTPLVATTIVAGKLLLGASAGIVAGFAWSRVLHYAERARHTYAITLAALLVLYVATEFLGGSGFLAALAFGIVITNARALTQHGGASGLETLHADERKHNHEIIFVFRSVYFAYLGVLVAPYLADPRFAIGAVALVTAMVAVRFVTMGAFGAGGESRTRTLLVALTPRGLSTAVGASLPVTAGLIAMGEFLPYVFCVVVAANLVTTVGVILYERGLAREKAALARAPTPQ